MGDSARSLAFVMAVALSAIACARPGARPPEVAEIASLPPPAGAVEVANGAPRCGMGLPPSSPLVAAHGCESIPAFAVVPTASGAIAFGVRGKGATQEVVAELLDAGGHTLVAPRLVSTAPGAVLSVAASSHADDAWVAWSWLDPRVGPVVRLDALALGANGIERGRVVLATGSRPSDLRIAALSDGRVAVVAHDVSTPCLRRCTHVFDVQLAAADGAVSPMGRLVVHGSSASVEDVVDLGDAVAVAVRASDDDDEAVAPSGDTITRSAGAVFRYGTWAADRRFVASCEGRRELFVDDGALLTLCHADATLTAARRMDAVRSAVKRVRSRCVGGRPSLALDHGAGRTTVVPVRGAWTGSTLLDVTGFELEARTCAAEHER